MYEKLSSRSDYENAFKKKGYIVNHRPNKSTKNITIIHDTSCENLKANLPKMFPHHKADTPKDFKNRQEYRHYDSYDDIKSDFEHVRPCEKCKPAAP